MGSLRPAEVFPPGEFIQDELEARGWTQGDLARILDRPLRTVNEITTGKRGVTPETARGLAEAFGSSAEYWLNLESAYRLSQVECPTDAISRRSRLYSYAPIGNIIRRGWIQDSESVDILEAEVLRFFGTKSLDSEPSFEMCARKSTEYASTSLDQIAWCCRANGLAKGAICDSFTKKKLIEAVQDLKSLFVDVDEVRNVPRILAEAGVRLVIVEHLPQSKIDGATFFRDGNPKEPVIALAMRFDRVDYFWFTLLHEIAHILNDDGLRIDVDLMTPDGTIDLPPEEVRANLFASSNLICPEDLNDFIVRTSPLYSKRKIQGFAAVQKVHPGIVVGQLQFRKEITYSHSREMLEKVREIITSATLTDGWGTRPSI